MKPIQEYDVYKDEILNSKNVLWLKVKPCHIALPNDVRTAY